MTRTDAHRPSAIDPSEYTFVGVKYIGPSAEMHMEVAGYRKVIENHMTCTGGRYARHQNSGTCHVCGAAALYLAVYHHAKTNEYITVGEDCDFKMESDNNGDAFRSLRKSVSKQRVLAKNEAKAREILALMGMSDAWQHYKSDSDRKEESIINSIVTKLVKYGAISEAQNDLIAKLLKQIAERATVDAARAEARAQAVATSNHVGTVGERVDMILTVQTVLSFDTQFGTMFVNITSDANGNVVVYKGSNKWEKGKTITAKVTIKEHEEYKGMKQTMVARPKVAA